MSRIKISNQSAAPASLNWKEKFLQHINDMLLDTNISLQKVKEDHRFSNVFVGGSLISFLGECYFKKFFETSVFDKSF